MARLRRWRAYRKVERPYTRVSKFKRKSYIRMTPPKKIVSFDMGEKGNYEYTLDLVPKASVQVRQEAVESARQTSIRWLERNVTKGDKFHFKIRKYPYHILRENPLAAGAGADRMSTGMKKSFGKPIGTSVQLREGERFFTVGIGGNSLPAARVALQRASKKLPCRFSINVTAAKPAASA